MVSDSALQEREIASVQSDSFSTLLTMKFVAFGLQATSRRLCRLGQSLPKLISKQDAPKFRQTRLSFASSSACPPVDIDALLQQVERTSNVKKEAQKKNKTKKKWVEVDKEKLKLSQRYRKKGRKTISEEGKVVKARRQLRTGRMIDEIITEMFSLGKVRMGPKIRDCRVIDVTDVSVSHDNKSATISWTFEEMFIESNVYDEKYLDNIASALATKSSKDELIQHAAEDLKRAMPQIRWYITKVLKGRRAPSLWFVYDSSDDNDNENIDSFYRMASVEERRSQFRLKNEDKNT